MFCDPLSQSEQQRSLFAIFAQEKLLNFKTAAFPPCGSNKKCVCPTATGKASGFGIEKEPLFRIRNTFRPIRREQSYGAVIGRIPRRISAPAAHRKILSEFVLLRHSPQSACQLLRVSTGRLPG